MHIESEKGATTLLLVALLIAYRLSKFFH